MDDGVYKCVFKFSVIDIFDCFQVVFFRVNFVYFGFNLKGGQGKYLFEYLVLLGIVLSI